MRYKICKKCNNEFPNTTIIDGKRVWLHTRSYCLDCSPRGNHNGYELRTKKPKDISVKRLKDLNIEELTNIIKNNNSIAGALRSLGMQPSSGNYTSIKIKINQLKIDISHMTGQGWRTKENSKHYKFVELPLDEVLIKNSSYVSTNSLKKKLFKYGLLDNICYECGSLPIWNGKKLVLRIDHIDGDRFNNTIENLRLLCPNCDSQTSTFCGRNIKIGRKDKVKKKYYEKRKKVSYSNSKLNILNTCIVCGQVVKKNRNKYCSQKCCVYNQRVVKRPNKEELEKIIWQEPSCQIAKKFNVSDTTIKKWCKFYKISKPERGYWRKLEVNQFNHSYL